MVFRSRTLFFIEFKISLNERGGKLKTILLWHVVVYIVLFLFFDDFRKHFRSDLFAKKNDKL